MQMPPGTAAAPPVPPMPPVPSLSTRLPSPYRGADFLRFVLCLPFFYMLGLLIVEAALSALTTWLVIEAGQDLANEGFLLADFGWIVLTQSAAYAVGACSWIFAEQAGFGAFGRYMLRFAKDNKTQARVLGNTAQRERAEPFLTNESFHIFFELVYELEADLKLFFNLLFNTLVLGVALDAGLPLVYGAVLVALLLVQVGLRRWISSTYAQNQRATNRMTAHTYNAWDNIFSGNRYNFRIWHSGFKQRLRAALQAQIRAIMAREGIAALGGIFALLAVFAYLALIAAQGRADGVLLISLAATLPKQIELSYSLHGLATGWNDLLAVWTRIQGAANAMHPPADAGFDARIRFDQLQLLEPGPVGSGCQPSNLVPLVVQDLPDLVQQLQKRQQGHIRVRGSNGAGKSTLLAALKGQLGPQAYYWPTTDKLSFAFNKLRLATAADGTGIETGGNTSAPVEEHQDETGSASAYSSGEQQLSALREIVHNTHARVYLFDEWDANLDFKNLLEAQKLLAQLAARALVVEISHRA